MNRSDDRLSELPDSLIFEIFWFLPITDVVRTTILSNRWKDLWKTTPFLNFSDYYDHHAYGYEDTQDKVGKFFNRALLLWRGAKLLKFKVFLQHRPSASLVGDIKVWVRFAKEKGVKELYLDLYYPRDDNDMESLYSCSSLEVLSIKYRPLLNGGNVNGNVKWDRLKSLTLHANRLRPDLVSKVLCGSPNLEVFILKNYGDMGGNWCIQSTSLKKLSVGKCSGANSYLRNSEMKIQTPNLETLEISGAPFSKFSMDVAPLTDVTLGFYCLEQCCNYGESERHFLDMKGTLEQILATIQHVESLTLSECFPEVLGAMNKKFLLSPLSKLKFLKLNASSHFGSFSKHEHIACLLQIFPKLERLVIQDEYMKLSEEMKTRMTTNMMESHSSLKQISLIPFCSS